RRCHSVRRCGAPRATTRVDDSTLCAFLRRLRCPLPELRRARMYAQPGIRERSRQPAHRNSRQYAVTRALGHGILALPSSASLSFWPARDGLRRACEMGGARGEEPRLAKASMVADSSGQLRSFASAERARTPAARSLARLEHRALRNRLGGRARIRRLARYSLSVAVDVFRDRPSSGRRTHTAGARRFRRRQRHGVVLRPDQSPVSEPRLSSRAPRYAERFRLAIAEAPARGSRIL